MADLNPNLDSLMEMSRAMPNATRFQAALTLAERFADDRPQLEQLLCAVGLAQRRDDGVLVALRDVDDGAWFVPIWRKRP